MAIRGTAFVVGRLVGAVLIVVAVSYQLVVQFRQNPDYQAINFFSYFTIQANLLAPSRWC